MPDLQGIESSVESLSVFAFLVVIISLFNEKVHLVGKDPVMVGVVVRRLAAKLVSRL